MIHIDKNTLDMEMVLGDTGTFSIAPKINKEPVINGSVWFTMRKTRDSNVILQKEAIITDGIATIELPPEDTKYLEPTRYSFDLKLIRPDGNIDTLLPGKRELGSFLLKKGVK